MLPTHKEFPEELYDEGKKLIGILDSEGSKYPIAIWTDLGKDKGWKLLLSVPMLQLVGSNDVIGNIKRIIRENALKFSADKICLIDYHDSFCVNLKLCFRTEGSFSKSKVSATKVNGISVPDFVSYRIL